MIAQIELMSFSVLRNELYLCHLDKNTLEFLVGRSLVVVGVASSYVWGRGSFLWALQCVI